MNENKKIAEGVKQVIDILSQKYNEQVINSFSSSYPNLYKKLKESETNKEKVDAISNAIDDLKFFAKELIPVNESIDINLALKITDDLVSGRLKRKLESIITDIEGRSCVSDKVNHIIGGMYAFLELGTNIQLYHEYDEGDNWLKDKTSYGKCAYWCTPLFKSTKSVINMLY